MLFNSYAFIFFFMPLAVIGYFLIAKKSHCASLTWLAAASLFFYGYWSLYSLPVLVLSILTNYWIGTNLAKAHLGNRKALLVGGVAANLLVLGYFKYMNFFIANLAPLQSAMGFPTFSHLDIILPIGISFFTFTQIAFLMDSFQGKVKEGNFLNYTLFVTFFPHLIAGPIIHHKQMMPQFEALKNYRFNWKLFALGITIFTLGLAKKLLIADPIAEYAEVLFDSVEKGGVKPQLFHSWVGSISYTFQLYFDFSGYSDMAVGLSMLFGIVLPINFNAPLKATNIIDFWQRWHISLTKYIGQYLYTPITLKFMRLGMNKSAFMEPIYSLIFPTLIIFLALGFWHGPSWTYVLFGGMHGIFIVINNLWRKVYPPLTTRNKNAFGHPNYVGWLLTFLAVNASLVMFRSDSVQTALEIYNGMIGMNGLHSTNIAYSARIAGLLLAAAFCIVLLLPSTATLTPETKKSPDNTHLLEKNWAPVLLGIIFVISVLQINKTSPFLYFQF
jgi:alginate O-acetyltransferase complex protein AlgI